jgi:hypothetical protein
MASWNIACVRLAASCEVLATTQSSQSITCGEQSDSGESVSARTSTPYKLLFHQWPILDYYRHRVRLRPARPQESQLGLLHTKLVAMAAKKENT